ncbi:hypothetical protein CHUAL_002516 [Chamberlinius hualienensis]
MSFFKQLWNNSGMATISKSSEKLSDDDPPPAKYKKQESRKDAHREFPNTLQEFGYHFNEEGRLCDIKTGQPFDFKVSEDHTYNQKRYEAIGEIITNHIYELLETRCGLKKLYVPIDRQNTEPQTFIFHSEDAYTNPDKLLLLIHGSGVVRAGQWARRLIMNDCLDSGTQIPFIEEALKQGYGVVVLNSNDNSVVDETGKRLKIRGSEDPSVHVKYVWKHLVKTAAARNIAIIAHSYGGVCTIDLVKKYYDEMKNRVFAIAFTDSVHDLAYQSPSKHSIEWLLKVARNWIGSPEPLDTPISYSRKVDIPLVSAGDKRHEMTSWSSFKSVFNFLSEQLASREGQTKPADTSKKSEL